MIICFMAKVASQRIFLIDGSQKIKNRLSMPMRELIVKF